MSDEDRYAIAPHLDAKLEERAEFLSEAARELPSLSPEQREELRTRVLSFLRHEIGEHMCTDQRLLYPKIAERLGDGSRARE